MTPTSLVPFWRYPMLIWAVWGCKVWFDSLSGPPIAWKSQGWRMLVLAAPFLPLVYTFPMVGLAGQVRPVDFPSEWHQVRETLRADKDDYNILFLPWPMRATMRPTSSCAIRETLKPWLKGNVLPSTATVTQLAGLIPPKMRWL